jgi:hypothetical protein
MRRVITCLVLATVTGCRNPVVPNTDIGLRVWAEAVPPFLSLRDSSTPLCLRVNVANPSDHAIRVRSGGPPYVSSPDPARVRGLWGSERIGTPENPWHAGPLVDWWGDRDSVYVIPAHSTTYNENVVTLQGWRAAGWPLVVGTYTVRGWFAGHEGASGRLELVP